MTLNDFKKVLSVPEFHLFLSLLKKSKRGVLSVHHFNTYQDLYNRGVHRHWHPMEEEV